MTKPFIIQLDLDGPVCTDRALMATGDAFDPIAAGMLAKLCAQTGAQLVICSDRRRDMGLRAKLASLGLDQHLFPDPTDWRTGHDPDGIRGNEIDAWNIAHPGHRWAIIDDQCGGYGANHIKRLVHVDADAGLSVRDIGKLRRLIAQSDDQDVDQNVPNSAQRNRFCLATYARDAITALDQGDDDAARALLALIADHPLAQ